VAIYCTLFQLSGLIGLIALIFINKLCIRMQILLIFFSSIGLFGFIGTWYLPKELLAFFVICLGISVAVCFTLILTLIGLKTSDPKTTASLSGMVQTIGYIIAAIGPFFAGMLLNHLHTWNYGIYMLIVASILEIFFAYIIGKEKNNINY
ncbi:MAG: hypothetical protein R3Y52_04380, partial [Psittacicella sp.]